MTSSDGSGEEMITDDEDQGSGNEDDVYPSSGTSIQSGQIFAFHCTGSPFIRLSAAKLINRSIYLLRVPAPKSQSYA